MFHLPKETIILVIFAAPGALNQLWLLKRRMQRWWNNRRNRRSL